MTRGHRASGDLIPWSLSQQYQDGQFAGLSGARIVRIATHTDVQKVTQGARMIHAIAGGWWPRVGGVGRKRDMPAMVECTFFAF